MLLEWGRMRAKVEKGNRDVTDVSKGEQSKDAEYVLGTLLSVDAQLRCIGYLLAPVSGIMHFAICSTRPVPQEVRRRS